MSKSRGILVLVIFVVQFFLINTANAAICNDLEYKYPNYSCEFCGKDTCEKFNRKMFIFNLKLNKFILRPINIAWASVMPKYGMDRIQSAYNNMNFPVRCVGCLLQKDFKGSKREAIRFLTNTTIGIGGLYDPAKTKFKLEPYQEDIEQVFSHYKIKQGPYLVLPVVQGNLRDLAGKIFDWSLKPTTYAGPFGAVANAAFAVNNTTYMQPMFKKVDETFADPYEIAKQVDGISRYIKNYNIDRMEYLKQIPQPNIIRVNKMLDINNSKADIDLKDYNPQGSLVDSMRTAMFDNQKIDSSIWADVSVWNRSFSKKLKIASVSVHPGRKKYRFRYILQKGDSKKLAIIYPSIGDGIMSDKSTILAKILYDEGYSVIIQGSAFNWEFVKSMPKDYKPGLPDEDARQLRLTTAKIIENLEEKKGIKFIDKTLVGCSFGALTALFAASQDEKEIPLSNAPINISRLIAINPPIEIMFSLKQLDNYTKDWQKDPADIKMRIAVTAEKIINTSEDIYQKEVEKMPEAMPFEEDEAKLIIGYLMKQKLYDVMFAVENQTRAKKSDLCETTNNMSFSDYAQKYLFVNENKSYDQFYQDTSLYSIADYLKNNDNYRIYHTLDDYFVNQQQLANLKKLSGLKAIYFSNGSHLGFMYRKEFLEQFKKDLKLEAKKPADKV